MARTVATNFTGGLQFPYATAAADIFKKEDVQTLALAVDQHDHGTGKGLAVTGPVNGAQIVDGTITSAKIADGTIATADLADNSVSSAKIADRTIANTDLGLTAQLRLLGPSYVAATTFSSTTAGSFVLTPVLVNANLVTNTQTVQVDWLIPIQNSLAGQIMLLGLGIDGGGPSVIGTWQSPIAGAINTLAGSFLFAPASIPPGAHVFHIHLYSQGGTMTIYSASASWLYVSQWNDG
jgi:hypothetical protein